MKKLLTLLLLGFLCSIGNAWATDETISWSGSSLTGTSGTNVSAGTASTVDGTKYKAGSATISSNNIVTGKGKHSEDYWEDFSTTPTSSTTNATSTARIEFPITISNGYSFNISSVNFTLTQDGGSGPAVCAYIVQGETSTWLGYTAPATKSYNNLSIGLSKGSAKLVLVLGVSSNLNNGRGFKFSNISIVGTSTAAACTEAPDAPTGLSTGSITSSGVTFTVTDAANTNNYEFYISTSNTPAPGNSTTATTTSTSKTKAHTGLTTSTTYYAWVRSVCDASHKSNWYGPTSFTTSAPAYSTSVNLEQFVLDNKKSGSYTTALNSANIDYSLSGGSLDSLVMGTEKTAKTDCNYPYLGLKVKKSGDYVQMTVKNGQTLKVKFGYVAAAVKLTIDGVAQSDLSPTSNALANYEMTASGDQVVKLATSSDGAVVFKQIMINEAIATVRPYKIESITVTNGTATTDLTKYAKGETVTVNYTPSSGYRLNSISVSGYDKNGAAENVTVTETNKFTMPGSPVNITASFIPSSVSASFSADWATFASIYPLDLNLTDGITGGLAYAAKEITTVGGHDQVVLTPCTGVVPANTGLMIKKVGSATSFTIATSTETPSAPESNLLEGAAEGASLGASDNAFILANTSGLGFYKVVSDITLAAGKAYLVYDGDITPAPSGIRIVVEENNTTDIEAIDATEKAVKFFENGNIYIKRDGVVYDVTGRVIR